MNNQDKISQAIVRLFDEHRFYAEVLLGMRRIMSTKTQIAGVCIKDVVELHLNEQAFTALPIEQRVAVLKHECEHILRDHIVRAKEIAPEIYSKPQNEVDQVIHTLKHRSLNIAADLAINQGLPDLPKGVITLDLYKNLKLAPYETMEYYHAKLKENSSSSSAGSKENNIDDHELWAESEGEKEVLRAKIKKTLEKAAERARSAGKMTAEDELLIEKWNKNLVDWKSQLKRFVSNTLSIQIDLTKKKRNRRYGINIPGKRKIEELHIGVAIDTSGSISDEQLVQFLSEIYNISKYAQITVVEADTEVKNAYKFNPKKKYIVSGRGGTAYSPALNWFSNEEDIDGLIYFGDMDCFDNEALKKPKYPVLWAIVGNQNPPANFGKVIRIPEIEKKE